MALGEPTIRSSDKPTRGMQRVLTGFGRHVRELRKKRGLSQEEIAFRSGLDRSYVGQVERGEKNIALINICRLAYALNLAPLELLAPLEPMQPPEGTSDNVSQ